MKSPLTIAVVALSGAAMVRAAAPGAPQVVYKPLTTAAKPAQSTARPVALAAKPATAPGPKTTDKKALPAAKPAPRKVDESAAVRSMITTRCLECHDQETQKGGLDLSSLKYDLGDEREFATWVKVHDRVRDGEMPPPNSEHPTPQERAAFKNQLAKNLITAEDAQITPIGRTVLRRINRYQYENTVRDLLQAPWLQLKDMLPEDGQAHRFNTVGEALDVSHVQMSRYLQAADYALRQVTVPRAVQPETTTKKYYARDEGAFVGAYNTGPEVRSTFPVVGFKEDQAHLKQPYSVGDADPKTRDEEGVGVVLSTYEPTEIRWTRFRAPVAGRYKLRFMAHTIWIGPKPGKNWWVPDYANISVGRRTEPILVYSDRSPRLLRKIGQFDATPEAVTHELDVWLLQGESIRPDAVRFFRPRPGDMRNPWATPEGQPGVSFRWVEVEGPLYDGWPTPGHKLLYSDLPLKQNDKKVEITATDPSKDAERLLRGFLQKAYRRPINDGDVARFLPVIKRAMDEGYSFQDAMLAGYSAVLCSPGFLYFDEKPGKLNPYALASRLSYFLWNTAPDEQLLALAKSGQLAKPEILRAQTNRLLDDKRSRQFVDAFLDYWLDLRNINANDADVLLYPDYQLDDLLVDSSVQETQQFFAELLKNDMPVKNIVASDWAMLNERLANHYGVQKEGDTTINGVDLKRVALPPDSPRGGLMTQTSILKVTANGTSTSPVLRGAWIMERILGEPPPPPPPSVPAIEPDTRGATTVRELLDKHRALPSCASCHKKIDPAGFALESFDVMGGWRDNYRALGDGGGKFQKITGFGHNGVRFTFAAGPVVDSSGELPDGRAFKDVRELKALLAQDDAKLARNLARQMLIYGTGAPVRFNDRPKVEAILNRAKVSGYGVRTLVQEIVQSDLFLNK